MSKPPLANWPAGAGMRDQGTGLRHYPGFARRHHRWRRPGDDQSMEGWSSFHRRHGVDVRLPHTGMEALEGPGNARPDSFPIRVGASTGIISGTVCADLERVHAREHISPTAVCLGLALPHTAAACESPPPATTSVQRREPLVVEPRNIRRDGECAVATMLTRHAGQHFRVAASVRDRPGQPVPTSPVRIPDRGE
jgi:hypothetical protein